MKLSYTTADGKMTVEFVKDTQVELWEELARFQEVFEDTNCSNGKESSDKVRFVVRTDDEDNKYYELHCVDTNKPALRFAKKKFGCHKKGGGLFPKGGWVKWDREKKEEVEL